MEIEFKEWKKISRLCRECVVTEKIDGTNAVVFIGDGGEFKVGSRSKWINVDEDNHGFAKWAQENKQELLLLGPGYHYGEWWGSGINRGYGLLKGDKRFSLFNTFRWSDESVRPSCCGVVPVLYEGIFDTNKIENCLDFLKANGSVVSAGFMNPEGIVVFHKHANVMFKKTLEKDEEPKSTKKQDGILR